MFWLAFFCGSALILGRFGIGVLVMAATTGAAWFWPACVWLLLCTAAARVAIRAHHDALRHLGSRRRLRALARPGALVLILPLVIAPTLPATAADTAAAFIFYALLNYAALITTFPGLRIHIDHVFYRRRFEEKRAAAVTRSGLPVPRPPAPAEPVVPFVAPYVEPSVEDLAAIERENFIHVHYDGRLAAIAGADEYHLLGRFDTLPASNPERRFVSMMAIYAMEIAAGERLGPYSDDAARIVARLTLVPAEMFERGIVDRDATAQAFGIPHWELGPEAVSLTRRAMVGA